MHIESKIKRDGGTHVTLGTTNYHFESIPDDGAHVCLVENEEHQDRFLSIPEGYRLYRKGQPAATIADTLPKPVAAPVAEPASAAERESLKFPDTFTIGGTDHSLQEVIALAKTANGLDDDLWADLTVEEQSHKINAQLDAMQDAADEAAMRALMSTKDDGPDNTGNPLFNDSQNQAQTQPLQGGDAPVDEVALRAELVAKYETQTGKKPHNKWSIDKIRAALED